MAVQQMTTQEQDALAAHTRRVEQRRQGHMREMAGRRMEWQRDGVRHLTHGPALWPHTRKDRTR